MSFVSDWEVFGNHFDERAKAEAYIRNLMDKGYEQVTLTKDGKDYAVFYKQNGIIQYHRIKEQIV